MGSGKSTAYDWFKSQHDMDQIYLAKFAKPLYDLQDMIYSRVDSVIPFKGLKDRKLLQFLGTDWGRSLDPDIWIKLWKQDNKVFFKLFDIIIVDDVRFNNEAAAIKSEGGFIFQIQSNESKNRINVLGEEHESEKGVNLDYIDAIVQNNGTIEEFHSNLESAYNEAVSKQRKEGEQ